MAELIWRACSDAWTEEQQMVRAETLKSVLQLQEVNNGSGSLTQTAQQKKADKAAEEAEKAAKEADGFLSLRQDLPPPLTRCTVIHTA